MIVMVKLIRIVVFIIFLITGIFVHAQSKFKAGIKAGLSIPNLQSSGGNPVSEGWSSRLGPVAGIVGEFELNERLRLTSEINYSSQGGKKNGLQAIPGQKLASYFPPGSSIPPYLYANYSSEVILNYLEIPFMLKADFPIGEQITFFLYGGPYAGFLLNAKNVTKGSSNIYLDEALTQPILPAEVSFDASTDINDEIKNTNFGIEGGIGLGIVISYTGTLQVSAGGNYGFTHIQKDKVNG